MSQDVGFSSGLPQTALGPAPSGADEAMARALARPLPERRQAVAEVVRAHPEWPTGWAELGTLAEDDLDAYAYFRVGYHRGLDALRKAGWRGSGYVRWSVPENRGFLRCLAGLERAARCIGEIDEAERSARFLRQLDPAWPPAGVG